MIKTCVITIRAVKFCTLCVLLHYRSALILQRGGWWCAAMGRLRGTECFASWATIMEKRGTTEQPSRASLTTNRRNPKTSTLMSARYISVQTERIARCRIPFFVLFIALFVAQICCFLQLWLRKLQVFQQYGEQFQISFVFAFCLHLNALHVNIR